MKSDGVPLTIRNFLPMPRPMVVMMFATLARHDAYNLVLGLHGQHMKRMGVGAVLRVEGSKWVIRMVAQHLPEDGCILETRINSLSCCRLHCMCSIAYKAYPPSGIQARAHAVQPATGEGINS